MLNISLRAVSNARMHGVRGSVPPTLVHKPIPSLNHRPHQLITCTPARIDRQSFQSRNVLARSYSIEGKIPEGVNFEVKAEAEGSEIEWNPETKTLRIPLSAVEGSARRTKLVIFTCNKCGGRTARNVNPVAWDKGLVMAQCAHCEVWHVLSAKNKLIFEEIRYNQQEDGDMSAASAGSTDESDISSAASGSSSASSSTISQSSSTSDSAASAASQPAPGSSGGGGSGQA
uniref:DNL-type domain-containing protein n=1 Tax=Chlamydomonas leiostraca TaxID=1034604 RepID=A0A7S0WSK4_9CHLO